MPDYRPTAQMLALVRLLEEAPSGALAVNDLAARMAVHRRTVVRWLQSLEREWIDEDGAPRVGRQHRSGVAWAVLTDAREPLTASIFQYAATLAASRHLGASLLGDSAADVAERVEQGLPASVRDLVPRVSRAFCYVPFAPKDHRRSDEVLDVLIRSVLRRQPVQVLYTSAAGVRSERVLEPWSLVMYRDGFYVLARSDRGDELLTFAVERMAAARLVRGGTFEVPEDFDPDGEFGRQLGIWRTGNPTERVLIRFAPETEASIRGRQWRGFVACRAGADGWIELSLDVQVTPELVSWILSWGRAAEVLAPESVRHAVAAELSTAAARYSQKEG